MELHPAPDSVPNTNQCEYRRSSTQSPARPLMVMQGLTNDGNEMEPTHTKYGISMTVAPESRRKRMPRSRSKKL